MADGVVLNTMSGGKTVASDEIAGQDYQRVKLIHGADGVNAGDVSLANGLPVQVVAALPAGDNNIGNIDIASMPAVTGTVAVSNLPATQPVSGAVSVSNFPVTQPVSGTVAVSNLPATQPVSGTVAVSNFPATQPISGNVGITGAIPAGDNNIGNIDVVSSALPTGAATSAKQDVDAALLSTIAAAITNPLAVGSSALPTGAATEAKQDTAQTALDGIQTAVQILDNAIAGNEMQVDVLTLPAVHFQDLYVTGQGSQTALNQNVVLPVAGTGSFDCLNGTTGISYRQVALTITPAAGTVTAGVITFEGSNDNVNFVPLFFTDEASGTSNPVVSITLVANTTRYMRGATPFRYFRARISTGITGTTTGVQCFSVFSTIPFSSAKVYVTQATAASLNVAATCTMAANATTTPAKAQDTASGATDTGIPAMFVRRDNPTAYTPAAGDFVFPQIGANGEIFVSPTPRTTGGLTPYRNIDVDEQKYQIKSGAGSLCYIEVCNLTTAPLFLQIYDNLSASVTVGTTTPTLTIVLPSNGSTNGVAREINFGLPGMAFVNGLTIAVTTAFGGSTGPAVNTVFLSALYK